MYDNYNDRDLRSRRVRKQDNFLPQNIPISLGHQFNKIIYKHLLQKTSFHYIFIIPLQLTLKPHIYPISIQPNNIPLTLNFKISGSAFQPDKKEFQIVFTFDRSDEFEEYDLDVEIESKLYWVDQQKGQIKNWGTRRTINNHQVQITFKLKNYDFSSDLFYDLFIHKIQFISQLPYSGLINQGNTCYMNSFLQMLFHINALRNLIFTLKIQDKTRFPGTLQSLFYKMMIDNKAVSTEQLSKSYGWSKKQSWVQQDIHEFSYLFIDVLQKKIEQDLHLRGSLNKLLKGQLLNYLECLDVDYKSTTTQNFYDLQLITHDLTNIKESLQEYTKVEILEGQNKYMTEQFGKQRARKGIKLKNLPSILFIHLKRFQYDATFDQNLKLLHRYQYSQILNLNSYLENKASKEQKYQLYSVLVHQGRRAGSGHYYSFNRIKGDWIKFNDQQVVYAQKKQVFQDNFGGQISTMVFDRRSYKIQKGVKLIDSTAYMLVYVRISEWGKIFKDIQKSQIPKWLQQQELRRRQDEKERKKQEQFMKIRIFTTDSFFNLSDFKLGLFYYKKAINDQDESIFSSEVVNFKIKKTQTFMSLLHALALQLNLQFTDISIFLIQIHKDKQLLVNIHQSDYNSSIFKVLAGNQYYIPSIFLLPNYHINQPLLQLGQDQEYRFRKIDRKGKQRQMLLFPNHKNYIERILKNEVVLVFLKIFKYRGGQLVYDVEGPLVVNKLASFRELLLVIGDRIKQKFQIYFEKSLFEVEQVQLKWSIFPMNLQKNVAITLLIYSKGIAKIPPVPKQIKIILTHKEFDNIQLYDNPDKLVRDLLSQLPIEDDKIFFKNKPVKTNKVFKECSRDSTLREALKADPRLQWEIGELQLQKRDDFQSVNYLYKNESHKIQLPKYSKLQTFIMLLKQQIKEPFKVFITDRFHQKVLSEGKPSQLISQLKRNKNNIYIWPIPQQIQKKKILFCHNKARTGQSFGNPLILLIDQKQKFSDINRRIIEALKVNTLIFQQKAIIVMQNKLIIKYYIKKNGKRKQLQFPNIQQKVSQVCKRCKQVFSQIVHLSIGKSQAISMQI